MSFQPSAVTFGDAYARVATAGGGQSSPLELTRAKQAMQAAIGDWNNQDAWPFLLKPSTITVSSVTTTINLTTTSAASWPSTILNGMVITASNVPSGTTVSGVTGTTLTMSAAATSSSTTATFAFDSVLTAGAASCALPPDFKQMYDVRLVGASPRTIYPIQRRLYDYTTWNQTISGIPEYYELFSAGLDSGQITLIPTPASTYGIAFRYYRRITVSTQDTDLLDVPQDFEGYLIALGKYLYLLDKGPEFTAQLAGWKSYASDGLAKMRATSVRWPDEQKMMIPGGRLSLNVLRDNPNTTVPFLMDW